MLRIEVIDDECAEGEAHIFKVPIDTLWEDIKKAVSLFYPNAMCVSIYIIEE